MTPSALILRQKKLSVLMLDARLSVGKQVEECAAVLGVSVQEYLEFEQGSRSPSLPQLEAIAYYFKIPVDHFWGSQAISELKGTEDALSQIPQVIQLRQRIVGAKIRQARRDQHLSLEELSSRIGMDAEQLERYELGEAAISLPELEVLVNFLGRSLKEFQDAHGPVGAWLREQQALQQFSQMPSDLQTFVSKPINRPYLELAARLSEMSVEKLRGVAEGLLEITL